MAMLSAAYTAPAADAQTWQPPGGTGYWWCARLWGSIDPGLAADGQVGTNFLLPKRVDPVDLPAFEGDNVGIGNLGPVRMWWSH